MAGVCPRTTMFIKICLNLVLLLLTLIFLMTQPALSPFSSLATQTDPLISLSESHNVYKQLFS